MKSPHEQILDLVVKMDARDARKVRDMADAHLRDLEADLPASSGIKSPAAIALVQSRVQAGLEVAVERERERLDDPDDDCGACEEDKHVGYTDDF